MNTADVKSSLLVSRAICLGLVSLSLGAGCINPFNPYRDSTYRLAPPEMLPNVPTKAKPAPVLARLPVQEKAPFAPAPATPKVLQIDIYSVLKLAQDHNGQIALGIEKLNEAQANQDLAAKRWLPDITIGNSYYRREGGIQDFYGNLVKSSCGSDFAGVELNGKLDLRELVYSKIEAERQVLQQKGELSKLTAEKLLDASTTYIELLFIRSGEVIAADVEKKLLDLRDKAKVMAEINPGLTVQLSGIKAELAAHQLIARKLRESQKSAIAKLVYLLGLEPGTILIADEENHRMPILDFVKPQVPIEDLVEQSLTRGPGVREMESLLHMIDEAKAKSTGLARFLPTMEVKVLEGAFGAGPHDNMDWANRLDLMVSAKWDLTSALLARERQRVADSKIQQAQITYKELRDKLVLGVQEAREALLSNLDMMKIGKEQNESAEDAYNKSEYRLANSSVGASPAEVLLSLRAFSAARLAYLNAVRELNKAQLRLFILVGAEDPKQTRRK